MCILQDHEAKHINHFFWPFGSMCILRSILCVVVMLLQVQLYNCIHICFKLYLAKCK